MSGASRPIRVHTLIDSLSWGGAEMLLAELAAGVRSAGIDLSVGYMIDVDGNPAAAGLRARGITPVHVPVSRVADARGLLRLRRHLARLRPDLVHTHLGLADLLGTIAARSLDIPSISTIHLISGQPTGRPADATWQGMLKARLAGAVRRHAAARVVTVSDAARRAYLAAGLDLPGHVVTVHNGIAPRDGGEPARVRAELGIAPNALVAVTVTVLRPGKGHDIAIEAVRRLRERFPGLRLLILGDGPAREEIAALAAPLGDAVIMAGHRDDVGAVLAASDVLVHPTRMDAFPTALLEAAAAGVPVLATDVGGVPEIVAHGRTGLLVAAPPRADAVGEALGRLLADDRMRGQFAAQARKDYEERFTAERWAMALRSVYDGVLTRRARRGSRSRHRS